MAKQATRKPRTYRYAFKAARTAGDAVHGAGLLVRFFAHSVKGAVRGTKHGAGNVRTGLKDGWSAS